MTAKVFDDTHSFLNQPESQGQLLGGGEQVLAEPDMSALSVLLAIDHAGAPCGTGRYLAEFGMTRADIDTVPWLPAIPPLRVL
ncbi:hypothetical protein [Mycobacteroides abscessus]|uniref:hypothetical protein n=1 Tax=Mycobacteroides abscessus TaxID=36809 RepID=UPI000C260625|nr:hypothetical protein [Mycobacteroides abscessus]MBE5461194.1 hypothetical protein [Mycobacteroides abscessus]QOF41974.1 hypothetical protein E3G69_000998 [Mycobacteroides abscessus]QOF46673.1 hypothetical protein E3G70_000997 [Mycobacteroides abscessus]